MIECKLCNSQFETQILFSSHLKKCHNMKYQDYYDSYLKSEYEGQCLVCGKPTTFDHGKYRKYCSKSCMRKSSMIQEKIKNTCIERYGGVGLASNKIKEKVKNTNIEKYGVENPFMVEAVKQKAHLEEATLKYKQTMLERYGVENPAQLDKNKQKMIQATHTKEVNEKRKSSVKKSNLDKYGVEYVFQREDVIQSIKDSKFNRQKQFCIENNCTSLSELISMYGTGWCQSDLQVDTIFDGNTKYIKNYEVDKIKHYSETFICSHDEEYIFNYIRSIYSGTIIQRTRKVISPYELDIYIPEKNLAIEYNGVYWHSINAGMDKKYHLNKTLMCEEKGIRLIHIFQNEWKDHSDICKSIIASALGIYDKKLYARNCNIKEVSLNDSIQFLEENHIQGSVKSEYQLGLYNNNELVQLITIGKSRYKKGEYELLRMCTKANTQVIGGFSKLMKHQPYKEIYSYIDRSKFNGVGYYKSNYEFVSNTAISYYYWSALTGKLNRLVCQKHKLVKLLGEKFDNSKTESQNMIDAGFYQIYDCGNIKVKYSKKPE